MNDVCECVVNDIIECSVNGFLVRRVWPLWCIQGWLWCVERDGLGASQGTALSVSCGHLRCVVRNGFECTAWSCLVHRVWHLLYVVNDDLVGSKGTNLCAICRSLWCVVFGVFGAS